MDALILVDIQNDFTPGGALAVPRGDEVVPVANALIRRLGVYVVATQDWHPPGHMSFASSHAGATPGDSLETPGGPQTLWPDHCVQQTSGASFHSGLDVAGIDYVIRKGADPAIDSYSGFFDNDGKTSTGLDVLLAQRRVNRVVLAGLPPTTACCSLPWMLGDSGSRLQLYATPAERSGSPSAMRPMLGAPWRPPVA